MTKLLSADNNRSYNLRQKNDVSATPHRSPPPPVPLRRKIILFIHHQCKINIVDLVFVISMLQSA